MINYNNGKIYKIEPICEHEEKDIYIGSTTKKHLSQRMATHRSCYKRWMDNKLNKLTAFELFDKYGIENCEINLIENVNCNSKDELLARESHYIRTLPCINKCIPNRTQKEYREDNKEKVEAARKKYCKENKEKISEKKKLYREANKEKISEKKKVYREIKMNCECGSTFSVNKAARHKKTNKHIIYLLNINQNQEK